MATVGFEVCHEAHLQNAANWENQGQQNSNRTGSGRTRSIFGRQTRGNTRTSRMQDFSLASFRLSNGLDCDESTDSSNFTNESGKSTETTYLERKRQKRRWALRLMAGYLGVAGLVFMLVVLWKNGLIFKSGDKSLNAATTSNIGHMYDESGNMVCNGLASNCHRRANEIMYATVHNAMSSKEHNFIAYNNLYPLEDALAAGFRGLTIDSCDCVRIGIQLCHGVCVAGFRRPVSTFQAIYDFLQENPHDIIVIELQIGGESLGPLFDELVEVSGLFDLMYQHPGGGAKWPTLREMIQTDKRLIVFAHDDIGCEENGECPAGVHPTFDYAFETPFDSRGASKLMEVESTCSVSRGWSDSDWVISNHFASNDQGLPDVSVASVTNAALNLQIRLDACQDEFQTRFGQDVINLLVVDFWSVGDTLEVVNKYNSALPPGTSAPTSSPSLATTEEQDTSIPPVPAPGRDPIEDETGYGTPNPSRSQITPPPTQYPTIIDENTLEPTTVQTTEVPTLHPTAYPTAYPTDTQVQETLYPTIAPTRTPSTAPSLSMESLFDTIINGPPTTTPPAVGDALNQANSTDSDSFASSAAPFPLDADNDLVSSTSESLSPTFTGTEEPRPQVEKEQPDTFSNLDTPLSSGFDYNSETLEPTMEDTFSTGAGSSGNDHAVFAFEKDPENEP